MFHFSQHPLVSTLIQPYSWLQLERRTHKCNISLPSVRIRQQLFFTKSLLSPLALLLINEYVKPSLPRACSTRKISRVLTQLPPVHFRLVYHSPALKSVIRAPPVCTHEKSPRCLLCHAPCNQMLCAGHAKYWFRPEIALP